MSDGRPDSTEPTRWWIGASYLALFGVSVPWYLPVIEPVPLWLGLPFWVVLSVAGSVGVALFTALVAVRHWPDDPEDSASPPS